MLKLETFFVLINPVLSWKHHRGSLPSDYFIYMCSTYIHQAPKYTKTNNYQNIRILRLTDFSPVSHFYTP